MIDIEKIRLRARLKMREYRKNPNYRKKQADYYRNWYKKNGRNRAIDYLEATNEWRINHPLAISAHRKVYVAILKGEIIKSKKCNICFRKTKLVGHHNDYSKPLEIMWLCSSCHKKIHNI